MPITINGSGTIAGASSFSTNAAFDGTLSTVSRGISRGSVPAGSILQVQQTVITSVFSTTSTSMVDITGLGVSITPMSSTSKILVMASLYRGCSSAVITNFRLLRAGTAIFVGDAASNRSQSSGAYYVGNADNVSHIGVVEMKYLDSPATLSAITYQVQMKTQGGETVFIGRTGVDSDAASIPRLPASIIVMEVAQ